MRLLTIIAILLWPNLASAQDNAPIITVHAQGSAEQQPDTFTTAIDLVGDSQNTREEALLSLQNQMNLVQEEAPKLQGLTFIEIFQERLQIQSWCEDENSRFNVLEGCNEIVHRASMDIIINAQPVSQASNMASYLSELGAFQSRTSDFSIENPDSLNQQALRAAFESARTQAEAVASSFGMQVGDVQSFRVNSNERVDAPSNGDRERISVTGSRGSGIPTVSLSTMPENIVARQNITVTFALLQAETGEN